MKKVMLKSWMAAAGCALFAASASALNQADSFESGVNDWSGNGSQFATNYTYTASVGRPLSDPHANVLLVEGKSSREAVTTENSATVDMMVQIALPDEELTAFPTSVSDQENIQIAVGVTTNQNASLGTLKVYCKPKSGDVAAWFSLGANYDKDSWHRVSFTFDYAHQLCQIRVDGEPIMSTNGYLTTDTTNLPDTPGSWYKLAKTDSTALASIQVIGCTAIDDVLVKDGDSVGAVLPVLADAATPITTGGISVDKTWVEAQGITRAQAEGAALDDSGMTVAQKYAAGYDVADGKKFELKDMTLSGSNATLKFNEADIPAGYKYVIETADNPEFTGATSTDVTGHTDGTATIGMGDGNVKYYRIRLVPASN